MTDRTCQGQGGASQSLPDAKSLQQALAVRITFAVFDGYRMLLAKVLLSTMTVYNFSMHPHGIPIM